MAWLAVSLAASRRTSSSSCSRRWHCVCNCCCFTWHLQCPWHEVVGCAASVVLGLRHADRSWKLLVLHRTGSSTACVLVVNGTTLSASNLGDSGFVLVRDGVATFQCPQQQHNFNFPFQLGSADSMSDQPQAAMVSAHWLCSTSYRSLCMLLQVTDRLHACIAFRKQRMTCIAGGALGKVPDQNLCCSKKLQGVDADVPLLASLIRSTCGALLQVSVPSQQLCVHECDWWYLCCCCCCVVCSALTSLCSLVTL